MDQSNSESSLGEGASACGRSTPDGEDELECYIPERRPSLDLGNPTPMDTSHWHDVERAHSPVPSYTSMESDGIQKSDKEDEEAESSTKVQLERTDSYSSSYSLDSDDCERRTKKDKKAQPKVASELPERPELIKDPDEKRHPALTVDFTFKAIRKTLEKMEEHQLWHFKDTLWRRYPESFSSPPRTMDMVDLVDRLLECYDLEVALQLTKALLKDRGLTKLVTYIEDLILKNEVRYELKQALKTKYNSAYEGLANQGEQKVFDSIFTELYITDGGNYGPNIEHEVRTIERLDTKRKPEKRITWKDILKQEVIEKDYIKSVVSNGVAGSGKSMAVQKFILEWAEGRSHEHVYFLFPLPFRELNKFKGAKLGLLEIVHTIFPETMRLKSLECDEGKVMFICDGLEEYYRNLDCHRIGSFHDSSDSRDSHVVVANLIKGNMVSNSILWVTSRPRCSTYLPAESVHQLMDIRGFTDEQKEHYFRSRFPDPTLADRVMAHLTSCKTIYIMCHLPTFCWVVCSQFQRTIREQGPQAELPKGITQMYTQLLLVLLRVRDTKVASKSEEAFDATDFLLRLGKMALAMLEKGKTTISKELWKESGLKKSDTVTSSGLCTEFMIEQFIMYQERVQTFIHPTFQEYMAALYAFVSFKNLGKNVLEPALRSKLTRMFKEPNLIELYRCAVERTLQCQDGTMDVFLRFLLGMALESNQELLQCFLTNKHRSSSVVRETSALLRKKIKENHHPDRNANLQLCLEELGTAAVSRSNSVSEQSRLTEH
ncbi:protein NLRC3 [Osmerus mordax]|uniref:protein NLRC3 n=1 Tax=Osmerus mordax TaxID=8014 RepID=UPI00350FBD4A